MDVIGLLTQKLEEILDEAVEKMSRSHLKHYDQMGSDQTKERLRMLCTTLVESLEAKSRTPMIRYAKQMGDQRFSSGFVLNEVQTAFNVVSIPRQSRGLYFVSRSKRLCGVANAAP